MATGVRRLPDKPRSVWGLGAVWANSSPARMLRHSYGEVNFIPAPVTPGC